MTLYVLAWHACTSCAAIDANDITGPLKIILSFTYSRTYISDVSHVSDRFASLLGVCGIFFERGGRGFVLYEVLARQHSSYSLTCKNDLPSILSITES